MWHLLKNELKNYFNQTVAYVLLVSFLVINGFFFFRSTFVTGIATLEPMFDLLPWLLLILVPALTMSLFSRERENGTIDILLTQPVKDSYVILSKFLAPCIFFIIALILTLPIVISLSFFANFDSGVIFASYFSALLLALSLISVNLFISSLTKNQVVAFIAGASVTFFLLLSGLQVITLELDGIIKTIFQQISPLFHYKNMTRGVIDTRDLVFFLTFITSFLALTYLQLLSWRSSRNSKLFSAFRTNVTLFLVLSVLINLLGFYIPGRIDLTSDNIYTLADSSKEILRSLPNPVTIKFYRSPNLPSQVSLIERDITDVLRDVERINSGNINVQFITVNNNSPEADQAVSDGISPVTYNIIKKQAFQAVTGYFGIAITSGEETKAIPHISETSGIEFSLLSTILNLTRPEKKRISFLVGPTSYAINSDLHILASILSDRYTVSSIGLDTNQDNPLDFFNLGLAQTDVLIIPGLKESIPPEIDNSINDFLANGGSMMYLDDPINVNIDTMTAQIDTISDPQFISDIGITIDKNAVIDTRSNDSVIIGQGFSRYSLPYPYWVRVNVVGAPDLTGSLETILLPWSSTVTVSGEKSYQPLLLTSNKAYLRDDTTQDINPDQDYSENTSTGMRQVGLIIDNTSSLEPNGSRIVIIGDAEFITNQYAENPATQSNILFALNIIDWLAKEDQLVGIRSKIRQSGNIVFPNENTAGFIRVVNIVIVPLIVIAFGVTLGIIRRRRTLRKYNPNVTPD